MPSDSSSGGPERSRERVDVPAGDLLRSLEFRSASLAAPFGDLFDGRVTVEVDSVVRLPDGRCVQYLTVDHPAGTHLVETLVELPTVADARLLSTVGDATRVEVFSTPDSLFSTVDDFDGVFESMVYDEGAVRLVAEFPADVDEDAVVDAVSDVYPDLELVASGRVETVERFRSRVERRLTDRQLTALKLAYFGGYYRTPRATTGAELADRMGISKQAFHEHLRKASGAVFAELLETGDDDTVLD